MKNIAPIQLFATLLLGILVFTQSPAKLCAQMPESATQTLLDRAHTLELRGRIDIAAQDWQQVLLTDPNNIDALAGLARSAKLGGNPALANVYLDRIKAINPKAAPPSHPLRTRPRPTIIPPSRVARQQPPIQIKPEAHPASPTQNSSNIAEPSNIQQPTSTSTPGQQAKSQTTPPTVPPQQEIYGLYVPYVAPAPKITPPQTEVAVVPPLSCPISKQRTPRIIPQRPGLSVARQQMQQQTSFRYGQQYPQPRPTPRSKPIQMAAPPAPCDPSLQPVTPSPVPPAS
jgi:hypothetical protein